MSFDSTGKVSLEEIYTQPDPRAYFQTLRRLDYCIPQLAKPYFTELIQSYRAGQSNDAVVRVLDIGCSYGINAALLRCDATMDELYERYSDVPAVSCRADLLEHDRQLVQSRNRLPYARFFGLDVAEQALSYASRAGWLDGAIQADLERNEPGPAVQEQLGSMDLVFSTGCVGYVTDKTLRRVLRAQGTKRPWMAHFVLRMFPFEQTAALLNEFGYQTRRIGPAFKQRLFSSPQEQQQILQTLAAVDVDSTGLEDQGWLYAQLYLSLPQDTAAEPLIHRLTALGG